jgi:transposase-like protein
MTPDELLQHLDINPHQLQEWLKRASHEGQVRRLNKPVRYQWGGSTQPLQRSMFDK